MDMKQKNPLSLINQNKVSSFKNFRKNVLILGKALTPKMFYPANYDKRNNLKRGGIKYE